MAYKEFPIAFWISGQTDEVEGTPFKPQARSRLYHQGRTGYRGVLTTAFATVGLEYDGISSMLVGTDLTNVQFHRLMAQHVVVASVSNKKVPNVNIRDQLRQGVEKGRLAVVDEVITTAWNIGRISVGKHQEAEAFALAHAGRLVVPDSDMEIPQIILEMAKPLATAAT